MVGRQEMSGRRGGAFDAFELSGRRAEFDGRVNAVALPRVADRLDPAGGAADVSWRIAGTQDARERPALEVSLDGSVPLVCQRCMRAFAWPVAQRTLLLLARDERELAALDEDDEHEVLLAAAPLDALTLIEDELLLTLPFSPRCARTGCRLVADAVAADAVADEPASAFAALGRLRRDTAKKSKD